MAKGAESKKLVFEKMLATFPGSFMADEKTLRIPMQENGEVVEIKVALTAAKDILGETPAAVIAPTSVTPESVMPTEEEKATVAKLVESLGL